jgi:hypothetical protein
MTSRDSEIRKEQGIRVFVDAHVHIHDCFGHQEFFTAAARNFAFLSSNGLSAQSHRYVLCLTETNKAYKFEELSRQADEASEVVRTNETAWGFKRGADNVCLGAIHPVLGEIEIVAGRQIVTAEKLEILALGTIERIKDGLVASDVVTAIVNSGAIPVLPWGFGKWLGSRRRAVEGLIDEFGDGTLYLGDNSGRPVFMADPAEFALARRLGIGILPGSDPLPFASECIKVGSFGFYTDVVPHLDCIWPYVRNMLQQGEGTLHSYGSLESPLRFVRNQVAMQYVTRISNRWRAN